VNRIYSKLFSVIWKQKFLRRYLSPCHISLSNFWRVSHMWQHPVSHVGSNVRKRQHMFDNCDVTTSDSLCVCAVLSGWCALALAPKSDKDPARGFTPPAKPPVDEIDMRAEDLSVTLWVRERQQQDRKRDRRVLLLF